MGTDGGSWGLVRLERGLAIVQGAPALLHEPSSTLIVADIHLGYEEAMARTGVFLPRLQLPKALDTLKSLVGGLGVRRVIINGDLKHAFNKLLKQEASETVRLVEGLREAGAREVVLVRGNHDNFIQGLLRKLGVEVVEDYLDLGNGALLAHGHKNVNIDYEVLIIGHEHPAVQINVGGGKVKYPAFLLVPLESGEQVIVLPALGSYQTGNPVSLSRDQYLSPIIREKAVIEEAVPILIDETIGSMTLPALKHLPIILA